MEIKSHVKYGKDGAGEFGGAQQPTPGTYMGRYDEGIDLVKNEETGSRRINIPVAVIEGDNDGKRFFISLFVDGEAWQKDRSFDQLCTIIDTADAAGTVTDYFTKKYAAFDTLFDDTIISAVVDDLKLKLTDKVAVFTTDITKTKVGDEVREYLRVKKIAPAGKKISTVTTGNSEVWGK